MTDVSECVKRPREARFLIVGRGKAGQEQDFLGAKGYYIDFSEIQAFYEKVDRDQALDLLSAARQQRDRCTGRQLMCMHCTRRQLIGAGAVGGMALAAGHWSAASGTSSPPPAPNSKVRICVVIAGKPEGRSWGLSESDLVPIMKRLAQAEKNLGNVEFVIGQASTTEQTVQLLDEAGPDAPVLAVSADIFGLSNFNNSNAVMPTIFRQGRPVAVFHMPIIGGHDWCLVNPWREEGHRITLFNTSDYDELERAASLLRVIPLLRRSRVLVSPPFKGTPKSYTPEKVKQRLGVEMVAIADGRYDEVMANVDERAAKAEAKRWLNEAKNHLHQIGPPRHSADVHR